MRGLEEKIWKVLAPNSAACSAACSRDPAVEVWMPSRLIACLPSSAMRGKTTGVAATLYPCADSQLLCWPQCRQCERQESPEAPRDGSRLPQTFRFHREQTPSPGRTARF